MSDEITSLKELKALETQLIKQYGESYFPITIKKEREPVEFVSTDCFSLDKVLGGGIPKKRILEFNGTESSYKSTLTLQCIAAYQRRNLVCALIDTECAFNPEYAKVMGVDVNKLMILTELYSAKSLAPI